MEKSRSKKMTRQLNEIATISLAKEWEASEEKWTLIIDALASGGIYVTSAAARSDALVSRLEGRLQKILVNTPSPIIKAALDSGKKRQDSKLSYQSNGYGIWSDNLTFTLYSRSGSLIGDYATLDEAQRELHNHATEDC